MSRTGWIVVGGVVLLVALAAVLGGGFLAPSPPSTTTDRGTPDPAPSRPGSGSAAPALADDPDRPPPSQHLAAGPGAIEGRVWREDFPSPARVELRHRPQARRASIFDIEAPPEPGEPIAGIDAGEDGRFRFTGLEPGWHDVDATAPDGARSHRAVSVGRTSTRIDLRLAAGGGEVLLGRAIHADGRPFRGVVSAAGERGARATPDEEGRFRLEGLDPGPAILYLTVPGRLRRQHVVNLPHEGVLEIVVDEGFAPISGQVVAKDDGSPVPGARVLARAAAVQAATTTDAQGRFTLDLPEGKVFLNVLATGFAALGAMWKADGDGVLRLVRQGTITGRVLSKADGRPVPGVQVRPSRFGPRETPESGVVTDEDGRYTLENVGPGNVSIHALGNGWVSDTVLEATSWEVNPLIVKVEAGQTVERDFLVVRTARVEGVVTDAEGRPAPGVAVSASAPREWRGFRQQPYAVTDAEGRYAIEDLVPTFPVQIRAHAAGGVTVPAEAPLTPAAGETLRVDLRLRGNWSFDLLVVEAGTGRPVVKAGVSAKQPGRDVHFLTDEEGRVRVGPIGPGPVEIRVDHGEYLTPRTYPKFEEGTGSGTVEMTRGLPIAGRIVRAEGSLRNGMVRLRLPPDVSQRYVLREGSGIDDAGRFRVGPVPPGRYEIDVQVWGERPTSQVFPVEAGREDHEIVLAPADEAEEPPEDAGELVVGVVGPDDRPASRSRIHLMHAAGMEWPAGVAEGGDRFSLRGVVGPCWFHVYLAKDADGEPLGAVAHGPFEPRPGEITVRLPTGRTIEGRVVDPSGRGLRGYRVSARWGGPRGGGDFPHGSATTDDDGRFVVGGLGDLDYRLTVAVPPRFATPDPVAAKAGARDVTIRLAEGGARPIRILDPEGRPVAGARLILIPLPDREPRGTYYSDREGRLRLVKLRTSQDHEIRVSKVEEGWIRHVRGIRAGGEEIEIRLEPGGLIRGRIEGIPAGVQARISASLEGSYAHGAVAADGTFEIRGVTPETWSIAVRAGRLTASTEARPRETPTLTLE